MDEKSADLGNPLWAGQTFVHPVGLAAVIILGVLLLFLPRRWAIFPVMIIACFIPSGQRLVLAGCDFSFLRIMVIFGFIRLILTREYENNYWVKLDTAVVLWALSSALVFSLRVGTTAALINRLGFSFDAFGMYFLFRCLIRNWKDVETLVVGMIIISVPIAFFFLLESQTGRNIFSVFGGVSPITNIREGKLRCQGAFSHPILAGSFWASFLPLFGAMWWLNKNVKMKLYAVIGIFMVLFIVFACSSSTPLFGVISAFVGGIAFFMRFRMQIVRWSVLFILIALHLMMDKPVWHLFARVSAVGGGTGWHRYRVIDSTIRYFDEWWLMGTSNIAHWGIWAGDITNQYVAQGLNGGLLSLALFIYTITIAFSYAGQIWRYNQTKKDQFYLSWAIGVSLFVHCMNFFGVTYFGQIIISWYLILAMIGSLFVFQSIRNRPISVCG